VYIKRIVMQTEYLTFPIIIINYSNCCFETNLRYTVMRFVELKCNFVIIKSMLPCASYVTIQMIYTVYLYMHLRVYFCTNVDTPL